jgi:hypothetical protein
VSTSHKAILSLIITVVLFAIFTFFSFAGLFDLIEMRFYNPSITAHITGENKRNAVVIEEFFKTIQNQLSDDLKTDAVRNSLMSEQNYEDFIALGETISLIKNSIDGIQWVRFIDSGGKKLHYSDYSADIISYTYQIPFYRNYNEPDFPYDLIAVANGGMPKYNFDGKSGEILFSFPLYDSFDIYCGTALFSLSMDSILNKLFNEGRIIPGKAIMLISSPHGIVFGDLAPGEKLMPNQISSVWETGRLKAARLSSPDSDIKFVLISTKTSQDLYIGSLIKEESYLFPWDMKLILLACFFLTLYLTIFLLFSFKQEPVTIIQNRLKRLQISLLEQFNELRNDGDWDRWTRELESRRGEINTLLKQGIGPVSGNRKKEIDTLINRSWDELLSLLGGRREPGFDEEKLRYVINSILAALPNAYKDMLSAAGESSMKLGTGKPKTGLLGRASAIVKEIEEAELVEEVEEIDEEEIDELEGLQKPEWVGNEKFASEEPVPPEVDIAALASQIEFSPVPEPETNEDDSIENDLEIVSPFSAMLDDLTDTADYGTPSIGGDTLVPVPMEGKKGQVPNAEPKQKAETIQNRNNVIKEKEGLPFISVEALDPEKKEEDFINPDFKNLVDSVIKD